MTTASTQFPTASLFFARTPHARDYAETNLLDRLNS